MNIQNCPLCHNALTIPYNAKFGDGIVCPHCGGDLIYDLPRLPQSIANPDKFAKDFVKRIKEKHPYKPPQHHFCGWLGGKRDGEQ